MSEIGDIVEDYRQHTIDVGKANARLMAAAPEMLTELRRLEWSLKDSFEYARCPSCGAWRRNGHASDCTLAAAIAKATDPATESPR